jgi:hypothetical protein
MRGIRGCYPDKLFYFYYSCFLLDEQPDFLVEEVVVEVGCGCFMSNVLTPEQHPL